MSRYVGVVCAGFMLLGLVGCTADSFLFPFHGPPPQGVIVDGMVPVVSVKVQEALADAGVSVLTKQVGDDLRLAGMTKAGRVFCLHLKPLKVEDKEKTRISIKWDKETDETFWRTVVQPLAAPEEGELPPGSR